MAVEEKSPYFLELSTFTTVPMIVSVSGALGLGGGVGIIPNETPVRLAQGETGSYFVTIHNGQDRNVTASFQTTVVSHPERSVGGDLIVTHPRLLTLRPGNNRVMVIVNAQPNASTGTYIIANSVFL